MCVIVGIFYMFYWIARLEPLCSAKDKSQRAALLHNRATCAVAAHFSHTCQFGGAADLFPK